MEGRKIARSRSWKDRVVVKSPVVNHPISGADPSSSYLDVIPEARALYRGRSSTSKRKLQTDNKWEYRGKGRVQRSQVTTTDSSSEDEEQKVDDGDEQQPPLPRYTGPLIQAPWKRRKTSIIDKIDELMKDFRLTDETYEDIVKLLNIDMDRGLNRQMHHMSTVKMLPTYVRRLPDGTERGRYLALDLGGTNFRVLLVDIRGSEPPISKSKTYLVQKSIMKGPGKHLFDHIAACMAEFMIDEGLQNTKMPLGFTFSFPCYQAGLASARLVRWTKGFKCAGVQGEDVVQMLHEAVQRRGDINVECIAVINDPVGAMVSVAHTDPYCMVGLILGTGTNCCYMEKLDKVELWDEDKDEPKQVAINTEWGAFGDNGVLGFIRNVFDRELDTHSLNPGHQLFEKMISGMYMGEIVRLVLCELTSQELLFGGDGSQELFTPNMFLTKYISEIESDKPEGHFSNTKLVLQEMDIPNFTVTDCRHVQHVCWQVSQRAAFLAASAVATVINRLDQSEVTVAVDGSLYKFHPHFKDLMNKKIAQLVKPHHKFRLVLSHDGSGKGAALVAAVAQNHLENQNNTTTNGDSNQDNHSVNNKEQSSTQMYDTLRTKTIEEIDLTMRNQYNPEQIIST